MGTLKNRRNNSKKSLKQTGGYRWSDNCRKGDLYGIACQKLKDIMVEMNLVNKQGYAAVDALNDYFSNPENRTKIEASYRKSELFQEETPGQQEAPKTFSFFTGGSSGSGEKKTQLALTTYGEIKNLEKTQPEIMKLADFEIQQEKQLASQGITIEGMEKPVVQETEEMLRNPNMLVDYGSDNIFDLIDSKNTGEIGRLRMIKSLRTNPVVASYFGNFGMPAGIRQEGSTGSSRFGPILNMLLPEGEREMNKEQFAEGVKRVCQSSLPDVDCSNIETRGIGRTEYTENPEKQGTQPMLQLTAYGGLR